MKNKKTSIRKIVLRFKLNKEKYLNTLRLNSVCLFYNLMLPFFSWMFRKRQRSEIADDLPEDTDKSWSLGRN